MQSREIMLLQIQRYVTLVVLRTHAKASCIIHGKCRTPAQLQVAVATLLLTSLFSMATSDHRLLSAAGTRFIDEEAPLSSPRIAMVDDSPSEVVADEISQAGLGEPESSNSVIESQCQSDEEASEIWEISTRHLPDRFRCINTVNPGFDVHRFRHGLWRKDSLENALVDDGKQIIFYVHGNFMERNNTRNRVRIVNEYLRARSQRPYRLILLSWPSQREPHALRDVVENSLGAEDQSLYLAWLLEKLGDRPQISLLGFSLGGRTVTGALHLVSGGSIPGLLHQNVAESCSVHTLYRVGLVAPAVDRTWLSPNGKHHAALDRVDAMINLYNSSDPILRRFRFLDRFTRPIAAGFAGFENVSNPRATEPLAGQPKIRQYDCSGVIGTTHSEKSYYAECPYFRILIDNLLWNEPLGSCPSQ
jgi:hypothetical protein